MNIEEIRQQLTAADETRAELAELLGGEPVTGQFAESLDTQHPLLGQRVIARTRNSGVSIGTLTAYTPTIAGYEIHLTDAVRLWQWTGAFTLSQVATDGPATARIQTHPEAGIWMAEQAVELLPISDKAYAKLMDVGVEGVR